MNLNLNPDTLRARALASHNAHDPQLARQRNALRAALQDSGMLLRPARFAGREPTQEAVTYLVAAGTVYALVDTLTFTLTATEPPALVLTVTNGEPVPTPNLAALGRALSSGPTPAEPPPRAVCLAGE